MEISLNFFFRLRTWIYKDVIGQNISEKQAGPFFPGFSDVNCDRRPQQGKF